MTVVGEDGSKQSLTATDGHPFWVDDDDGQAGTPGGRWVDAVELKRGQWLKTAHGDLVQVAGTHAHQQNTVVYNLTVADIHTYYVLAGDTPVLVHNCPIKMPGGGMRDKPNKLGMASGRTTSKIKAAYHKLTNTQPAPNATVRDLVDRKSGNRQFPDKAGAAAGRDADELLNTVFRPKSLMYMTVNPHNRGEIFEGNHRRVALMRAAEDPQLRGDHLGHADLHPSL